MTASASDAATYVVGGFLVGLAAVVAMQLLTGAINMRFLLHGTRKNGDRYFSPERVQLLTITSWVAFNYLLTVMNNPNVTTMPDVGNSTLALLGGSHGVYLGGKAISRLLPVKSPSERTER